MAAAWLALAAAPFAGPALAKDLGVRGQTWAIAEPDLLARIEARLSDMARTGELARLELDARSRARSRIEAPERIAGIAPARERRTWLFDPAITVERDIAAADGTLIAAAGTRIDPFAQLPPARDLVFVDGTRAVEIDWALGACEAGEDHPSCRPAARPRAGPRPALLLRPGRTSRGALRPAGHAVADDTRRRAAAHHRDPARR